MVGGGDRSSRRDDIQGLRALAVLLVVIFHASSWLTGGYVGVDVFFVISGYVITRMLFSELQTTGRLQFGKFYLRRIRRLLPALAAVLIFVLLTSILLGPVGGQQLTSRTGAFAAVFNGNNYLWWVGQGGYFDVRLEVNALLHTWSLAVEEQFYLLFPALIACAFAYGGRFAVGRTRTIVAVLTALTAVSFILSWVLSEGRLAGSHSKEIAFYSAPTRAWEFASGALLVFVHPRWSTRVAGVWAAVGACVLGFAAFRFDSSTTFPGVAALVPVAGTLLLLVAGKANRKNVVSRVLSVRPMRVLGDLSYSWYLWHWPFIVLGSALWPYAHHVGTVAALASLVPAWLSFKFVENPIRFTPEPKRRRTLLLAGLCVVSPLVAAVALEAGHSWFARSTASAEFDEAFARHADSARSCISSDPLGKRSLENCTWSVPAATGTAVLIGDSNAGQFTEAFTAAMNAEGLNAVVATMSSCPFADVVLFDEGRREQICRRFVAESTAELVQMAPALVVVASASDTYIEGDRYEFADETSGRHETGPAGKASLWAAGLERLIGELEAADIKVVVVHPIPKFPGWEPLKCAVIVWLSHPAGCGATTSREDALRYRMRAFAAEGQAVAATSATPIDFFDQLCPRRLCSARRSDGVWLWRDGNHISIAANGELIVNFRSLA